MELEDEFREIHEGTSNLAQLTDDELEAFIGKCNIYLAKFRAERNRRIRIERERRDKERGYHKADMDNMVICYNCEAYDRTDGVCAKYPIYHDLLYACNEFKKRKEKEIF